MSKAFQVGYPCPVRKQYDPALFQLRDSVAFSELVVPLHERGFRYQSPVCLYPFRGAEMGDVIRGAEHYQFLSKDDCLVMTTRPPLDDLLANDKKHITPSNCHLEQAIFASLRPYFESLCRSNVRLSETLVSAWAKSQGTNVAKTPAHFNFRQNLDARLSAVASLADEIPTKDNYPASRYDSIGFFVHLPAISEYDCRLIASFGMGGNETAVWNRIVSTRHIDWLDTPRFVAARMDLGSTPDCPVTLDYAENIQVEILVDHPIAGGDTKPAKKKSAS